MLTRVEMVLADVEVDVVLKDVEVDEAKEEEQEIEETEDEMDGLEEADGINEMDVEEEADESIGTIIVNLYKCIIIFNCFYYMLAYSRSQTHVAFSYHVVINSTQLHYRYLYSYGMLYTQEGEGGVLSIMNKKQSKQ